MLSMLDLSKEMVKDSVLIWVLNLSVLIIIFAFIPFWYALSAFIVWNVSSYLQGQFVRNYR